MKITTLKSLFGGSILTLSIMALALVSSPVSMAQDDQQAAGDVEEITVTGSRIKRDTINSASVVTTITAEDIEESQALILADALRLSTYNTFGSFGPTAGSSAMSNATVSVRGLGSSRTLVLMDGRRMPGSPHLGGAGAVNINMIPTVAVERVEILADGASSVYGSDAIAGVINVITKKNFDGLQLQYRRGDRDRDDGEENSVSMIYGSTNDKGYVTLMVEHDIRDEIYLKDRWYTAARASDQNGDGVIDLYNETYGLSWYSQNLADPVTGNIHAAPTCQGNIDGSTTPWWGGDFGGAAFGQGATVTPSYPGAGPTGICGYAWADIMVQDAGLFRDTVTSNLQHQITDKVSIYNRTSFVRNESVGRFAPPAARYPGILASDPANPYDEKVTGYWRWTEIGNRGMHYVDQATDVATELEIAISDNVDLTIGHQVNKFYGTDIGRYYLDYAGLDSNLYNDIPFGSEAGLYALAATTVVEYDNHYEKMDAVVQFSDVMELPGGSVDVLLGYESFDNTYSAMYDKHSEGGYVGGSAGNSGMGVRSVDSYFGEAIFPVMDGLELNASFRSDDYSDVGSSESFKFGLLWDVATGTTLKMNYGEGFRAPSMDTLYGVTTFSANTAKDYKACAAAGTSTVDCASKQISTLIVANANLGAEESEGITMSLSHDFGSWNSALEGFQARLDYYDIEISGAIVSAGTQSVMWTDFIGGSLLTNQVEFFDAAGVAGDGSAAGAPVGTGSVGDACPSNATYYKRLGISPSIYTIRSCGSGRIDYVGASYANAGKVAVKGYDIFLNYTRDVGPGSMDISLDYSNMTDYLTDAYTGSASQVNNIGFDGTPENRYNLSVGYKWGDFGVVLTNRHIGDYRQASEAEEVGGELTGGLVKAGNTQDDYDTYDIQAYYNAGKWGKISLGIQNMSDEDPLTDNGGQNYDAYTGLYDNRGKITYLKWKLDL
ncbi:MAG: TonB-dependent receptor [Gammaproteobacteria bacterium]|nr:TonB-dependent receptor [Gammaproteobacteria bacterium]